MKIGSSSAPFLAVVFAITTAGLAGPLFAQGDALATTPFIGFRPFDTLQSAAQAGSGAQTSATAPFNVTAGSNNTSAYPYPDSITANRGAGLQSQFSGSALQAAEQATFSSRFNGARVPTGGLNQNGQATTMAMPGNVGNVTNTNSSLNANGAVGAQSQASIAAMQNQIQYQQQILQLQATQQRQLQLIQQQQQQLANWQNQQRVARASFNSNFKTTGSTMAGVQNQSRARSVLETGLQKNAMADRRQSANTSTTRSTSRLNQAVVQQVGSTMKRTAQTSAQPTARVAQANSVANRVAKIPQANCCVPVNCCAPQQQARVFQPPANLQLPGVVQPNVAGAANLAPSLNPGAATNQGFLGQAGAGYQSQLGGYQFQSGLGTPPISQAGSGGWISNLIRGTSAYTPLLPIEPLYPNTYFGRGIIGQPTAYVGGQPVRNLMRYIFP